jgi:hypothetical protein
MRSQESLSASARLLVDHLALAARRAGPRAV